MIIESPNKNTLTDAQVSALRALPTGAIADALGSLGYAYCQALPAAIHSMNGQKMVGLATPVYALNGNSLPLHLAVYLYSKDRVLVLASDGYVDGPYIGDVMSITAQHNGCLGLVIDGNVRDVEAMKDMKLPIFAKGSIPNQPAKEDEGSINEEVQIGHATIRNGDVMVGDETGIVAIPFEILDTVIEKAQEKEKKDAARFAASTIFDYESASAPEDYLSIMTPAVAEYVKEKMK